MQNLFVNENDEFTVGFTVATDEKGTIFCDLTKESLVESFGEKVDGMDIQDYKATFKRPSFGDSVGLYDSIFQLVNGEDIKFNPVMARYNKIKALIKSWDLKGKDEKPTEEDIKALHPTISTVISIQLDMESGGIFG